MQGNLTKMAISVAPLEQLVEATEAAQYQLRLGDQLVPLNEHIGKPISLIYSGTINCTACGRKTNKSYSQGHCFPCMKKLPSCDMCIMKPETCHYAQGTCRDPQWGEANCMVPHYVYLANTSGLKVGITRHTQIPTRWLDQGATEALPLLKVSSRQLSGLVEVAIAEHVADKTNWRAMLKGNGEHIDLVAEGQRLLAEVQPRLEELEQQFGAGCIERLGDMQVQIQFPVTQWPVKIASHNFDKNPEVTGVLQGIKGQYLILDTGVINLRKFTGYDVAFKPQ
ncbi:DUF2797 domain-containing protein [Ferrimonas lipolytica]|uniref:DUF2797 domain-containing protein n=1 Tax=Ferrimonas lipolytica TaxID=2724191 RepID=A0A6H1UH78_9GAMM|nr:DUF2797 domain-containing protein [Ferrimonas lipolytica]QIZ77673.1 DUF2797 domain-containing protein [Ferrimonas lipolytica]